MREEYSFMIQSNGIEAAVLTFKEKSPSSYFCKHVVLWMLF